MALGLTQPITEMSKRIYFLGGNACQCLGLTTLPLSGMDYLEILGALISWNPVKAWTGPEGSRRLRLPDFKTIGT